MKTQEAIQNTKKVINAWMPRKIFYGRIPGISVGITYKGRLVYKAGFGFSDIKNKKKTTSKTPYRIASISKTLTSIAILQLYEKKKLNLDDPLIKHIPWFKAAKGKVKGAENITIRQILTHSGGIFRDGTTAHWSNGKFPNLNEFKKELKKNSLVIENQKHFKYSNYAFSLLGEVIKSASGLSYEDYIRKFIIKPLGLVSTQVDLGDSLETLGYGRVIPGEENNRQIFKQCKANSYIPAAGFISNVEDLARVVGALSLREEAKDTILSRETKKEMLREHWRTVEDDWYGLGVEIYKIKNRKVAAHSGGFPGFASFFSLDLENDIGVITLSNTSAIPLGMINSGILKLIYYFIDKKDEKPSKVKLDKYAGTYQSIDGETILVSLKNFIFSTSPGTNQPSEGVEILIPQSKKVFGVNGTSVFSQVGENVTFRLDKKNNVTGLLWGSYPLKKIEQ
ncbi:hypothetical protein CL654_02400 [bacterium]|nr:hypothetical protein [bacterium]|tara:strand:- start:12210 stop:13565 length:1356 start_codon:yes stop_codon:yes gene_type:complete